MKFVNSFCAKNFKNDKIINRSFVKYSIFYIIKRATEIYRMYKILHYKFLYRKNGIFIFVQNIFLLTFNLTIINFIIPFLLIFLENVALCACARREVNTMPSVNFQVRWISARMLQCAHIKRRTVNRHTLWWTKLANIEIVYTHNNR